MKLLEFSSIDWAKAQPTIRITLKATYGHSKSYQQMLTAAVVIKV